MKKFLLLLLVLSIPLFAARKKHHHHHVVPTNPVTISSTTNNFFTVSNYQFGTDLNGNTVIVWSIFDGSNYVLQSATRSAAGVVTLPGPPSNSANLLSPQGFSVQNYQLEVDLSGNAVVVWQLSNNTNTVIQASFKPANGSFIPPGNPTIPDNDISPTGFNVSEFPSVAIFSGNVVIAWQISNGFTNVVQAVFKPAADLTFPTNPTINTNILSQTTPPFTVTSNPQVAMDNFGNAAIVWQIFNGNNNVAQLATNHLAPGGQLILPGNPLTPQGALSPLNFSLNTPPQVSIDNNVITVLWLLNNTVQNNVILQGFFQPLTQVINPSQ